jgi:putative FmdB family regulatory protein
VNLRPGWLAARRATRAPVSSPDRLVAACCFTGLMLLPIDFHYWVFALLMFGKGSAPACSPRPTPRRSSRGVRKRAASGYGQRGASRSTILLVPRYEFRCRACGDTFLVTRPMSESGAPAACPQGHDDTVKLLSTVAVGGRASGAGAPPATMGGGGGCCGGSCGCG